MKNKILFFTMLALVIQSHAKVVTISRDNPYTFSIISSLKKRPVTVHKQNEDYLRISCKSVDSFIDSSKDKKFIHSCSIRPKSDAPEGTFALFKKNSLKKKNPLFHVTVDFLRSIFL